MRLGIYKKFSTRLGTAAVLAMVAAADMGCSMQTTSAREAAGSSEQFVSVHLAATPTFSSHTGAVSIVMSDETAELYVQASDSSLMINGVQAIDTSVTPNVVAIAAGTKANIKTIAITDTAGAAGDVVILNYVNGLFGQGTHTVAGTTVAMKSGLTNALVIKAQATNDSVAFGANGVTLNNTATTPTLDVASSHVSTYDVYLGAGDDKFTAGGNSAVGGVFTSPVFVYGGPGNDTLVEGTVSTPNETFSGGPGSDTVDYSARTAPVSVAIDPLGVITSGAGPTSTAAMTPTVDTTLGATEGDVILDAEVIIGGTAADQLMGGIAGSVTLNGGAGNDTFCEGDDTYKSGTDTLVGGGGVDTVDYSKRTHSLTIVMDGKTVSGDPLGNAGAGEKDIIGTDVANIMWGGLGGDVALDGDRQHAEQRLHAGPRHERHLRVGRRRHRPRRSGREQRRHGHLPRRRRHRHGGLHGPHQRARRRRWTTRPTAATRRTRKSTSSTSTSRTSTAARATTRSPATLSTTTSKATTATTSSPAWPETTRSSAPRRRVASENNDLHGNDVADTAESGAFNLCINVGDTSTTATPAAGSAAVTANCQLAQN